MICPECGGEFVDGIRECPDCRVPLAPETADDDHAGLPLVEVARTTDQFQLPILRSLLAAEGIPVVVQGEHWIGLEPLGSPGNFAAPALGAALLVPADRREEAEALLAAVAAPEGGAEEPPLD